MKFPLATRIYRPALGLLTAALLIVGLACNGGGDSNGAAAPPAAAEPVPAPSPRPLTAAERADIADFAQQQTALAAAQETLRQDFDAWQAGLTACRPVAAQTALRDFAADFAAVTGQARNLPRGPRARDLADLLIQAAELEAAALRQLRDRWQPGSIALFEAVERERSESARAQNSVRDLMQELRKEYAEAPTPQEIAAMQEFSNAFNPIERDWNAFHDAYAALRMEQSALEIPDLLARYNALIGQSGAISAAMDTLTPPAVAESLVADLRRAAAIELTALGNLLERLRTIAAPPPPATPEPPPAAGQPSPDANGGPETAPPPELVPAPQVSLRPLLDAMDALDAAVNEAQSALDAAAQSIRETINDESAENLADLDRFETAYNALTAEWDAFHAGYAQWRQTDGGCDRAAAVTALEQFSRRAAELARQTGQLPQSGYLRPIQSLLSDAAGREETALQALSQTWRPFTAAPFLAAAQERANADAQRRQAAAALRQLQARP